MYNRLRFWFFDTFFQRHTQQRLYGWYQNIEFRDGWIVFGRFVPCDPNGGWLR